MTVKLITSMSLPAKTDHMFTLNIKSYKQDISSGRTVYKEIYCIRIQQWGVATTLHHMD